MTRLRRRVATRAGQRGMTMVETLLTIMLGSIMIAPMAGWATFAMREQVEAQELTLSGASLGILRTYFQRDVTSATAAWVDGDALDECRTGDKGEQTLLVLADGERRIAYSLTPDDEFTSTLWRVGCAEPKGPAADRIELATDVIDGGTTASCANGKDLAAAAEAAGIKVSSIGADPGACQRVTLQLTTSQLDQVAMSAFLRSATGALSAAQPPVAVATAVPTSGARRLTVQFDGSGSSDPAGGALTHAWDFGDGGTSDRVAPTHDYVTAGTFTATLTVTSSAGQTATTALTITVADNVPTAVISAPSTGTTTYRGATVAFSSAGSNDDKDAKFGGRIVGYAWDFGDGSTSTEADPKKVYATTSPPGGFTVRLAVFDDAGQTATTETKVVVANRVPTVSIEADVTSGTAPLTVDLTSKVVDETTMSPNPALTYAWDFGDGGTSALADPPARTYATAGDWTVTLTVTDDLGATATATQVITVKSGALPAPKGLAKSDSGSNKGKRWIEMEFEPVAGAAGYEVRLTCASKNCVDGSATGDRSPVRVDGLQNRKLNYDAQVRTLNGSGEWGPWSDVVRVTV